MSAVNEYKHTSWSENCPLCVQLKGRADAAIAELEVEKSQLQATLQIEVAAKVEARKNWRQAARLSAV